MKVTLLGTGTSQGVPVIGCQCATCLSDDPKDHRLRSSVLISVGNKNILIDAGPDMRQQLLKTGITTLDAILLTHEHNDHIIGLDEVRPFNFRQQAKIPIYTTKRIGNAIKQRFDYAFTEFPYPGAPRLELKEITPFQSFTIEDINILPLPILHGELPILGFQLGDFTYITDAKWISDEVLALIKNTKTLVINALHWEQHHSHFNVSEALAFIDKVAPQQAFLTHISHLMGKGESLQMQLPTNVSLGFDGQEIHFNLG